MSQIKNAALLTFALLLGRWHCPCAAAADLNVSQMVEVIKNSGVLKSKQPVRATYDDRARRAVILTERVSKATDDDCKIDSVLVAKKVIDAFPENINFVRVIFDSPETHKAQQVDVSKVDVKAYGSGAVKASELLQSLSIVDASALAEPTDGGGLAGDSTPLSVVPGPFQEQRLILLGRIADLRQHGTDMKPFQALFDKIEATATQGDAKKLAGDIPYLSDKLKDEEELVKQAGLPKLPAPTRYQGRGFAGGGTGQRRSGDDSPIFGSGSGGLEQRYQRMLTNVARIKENYQRRASLRRFQQDPPNTGVIEDKLRQAQSFIQSGQTDQARRCLDEADTLNRNISP